jgi:hypothetical protein
MMRSSSLILAALVAAAAVACVQAYHLSMFFDTSEGPCVGKPTYSYVGHSDACFERKHISVTCACSAFEAATGALETTSNSPYIVSLHYADADGCTVGNDTLTRAGVGNQCQTFDGLEYVLSVDCGVLPTSCVV